ncbi:MAG: putative processing-secretion protein [Anaerocolumna sp.]|jgi:accessory gene regulator B|nr:putative processing-secretion protein [Anaerocolumna sp.]
MRIPVSKRITYSLANGGVITSQDKDLYTYGLKQGLLMIINLYTALIIALIFGMVWQSLIFLLAYIPLRSYAGGYHAKTQLRCYLLSIVIILATLLGIKLIPWTSFICLMATLTPGGIIFFLAPVESGNIPLDHIEIKVYKRRTRTILLFEACILLIFDGIGSTTTISLHIMVLLVLNIMLPMYTRRIKYEEDLM